MADTTVTVLAALVPWAVWVAWWLAAVNWRKAWPMLAEGGWVPALLLAVMAGFAWAMIDSRPGTWLGLVPLPNGWWQMGTVATLAAVALFCGWLQGYFGWTPQEVSLEPPPAAHEHHDAAHAHH